MFAEPHEEPQKPKLKLEVIRGADKVSMALQRCLACAHAGQFVEQANQPVEKQLQSREPCRRVLPQGSKRGRSHH